MLIVMLNLLLRLHGLLWQLLGLLFFSFLKMGRSQPLFLYFHLFYLKVQLEEKILLMLGFRLLSSGVGSNRSTN